MNARRSLAAPLVCTPGEPAGIGPDLLIAQAQQPGPVPLVAIADPELLRQRAAELGLPLRVLPIGERPPVEPAPAGALYVDPVPLAQPAQAGRPDPANAPYILQTLRLAAAGCQQGRYAALVTGPVHKGVINDAGVSFSGHTEFLAECVGGHPVMMLTCPGLRVALATTHLPLRAVPDAITAGRLEQVLGILTHDLRTRYGIAQPRILVAGLNPHAGEGGHLGTEEQEIITPTLERLRQRGLQLDGPLPADTLFTPPRLAQADAVLAMYHDQGLTVLKHRGFGRAVNVTLGLPIIRTSVDHGTALDLAGTGRADRGSLQAALAEAQAMLARPDA